MVLRPSVGNVQINEHAPSHERNGEDSIRLQELEGYDELEMHKAYLDDFGLDESRAVDRVAQLQSYNDSDGSIRLVKENNSIYRRIAGTWQQVNILTDESLNAIDGSIKHNLFSYLETDWESGSISTVSGSNLDTRPRNLRMRSEKMIIKGAAYTLSCSSVYLSAIDKILLIQYSNGSMETVDEINRGQDFTFYASGDSFRIAFEALENTTVQPYFLSNGRINVQMTQDNKRSNYVHNDSTFKNLEQSIKTQVNTLHASTKNLIPNTDFSNPDDRAAWTSYGGVQSESWDGFMLVNNSSGPRSFIGRMSPFFEEDIKEGHEYTIHILGAHDAFTETFNRVFIYSPESSVTNQSLEVTQYTRLPNPYVTSGHFNYGLYTFKFTANWSGPARLLFTTFTKGDGNNGWFRFKNVMMTRGNVLTDYTPAEKSEDTPAPPLEQTSSLLAYKHLVEGDDWTTALQTAVNENSHVHIPAGEYRVGQIQPPSNTTISGEGNGTTLIGTAGNTFYIEGSEGAVANITSRPQPYATLFLVNTSLDFDTGDDVLIQSRKNCISEADSGENWTMGGGTSASHVLPFGEFSTVAYREPNRIRTEIQPIFPFYDGPNSTEVNPAQDTSTVTKINFVKNVKISNMRIVRTRSGAAVRTRFAKNCEIENVFFDDVNYTNQATIMCFFVLSWNCVAKGCRYESALGKPAETYYNKNVFKCGSSMYCGFKDCYSKGAGQAVDFSYFSGRIPCTGCFVEGCRIDASSSTGITTHGGTYMSRIVNNIVTGHTQGIGCRSRQALISGNLVTGGRDASGGLSYGIGLYEGHAVDCTISDNQVSHFRYGIGIFDAVDAARHFKYTGSIISNNTVFNCFRCFWISRHSSRTDTPFMGVLVKGNHFKKEEFTVNAAQYITELPPGVNGVTFDGNTFKGTTERGSAIYAVYANADCTNIKVINNMFYKVLNGFTFRGNDSSNSILDHTARFQVGNNTFEGLFTAGRYSIQFGRAVGIPLQDYPTVFSPDGRMWELRVDNDGNVQTNRYFNED